MSKYGIANIGQARAVLNGEPSSPLAALLRDFALNVCGQLQESLKKHNVNTSALGLSQSIQPTKVSITKSAVSIGIEAEHYWKFVNYGVNGTEISWGAPAWGTQPNTGKSFHQNILEWIPKRGVKLPPQFDDYNSFAWAIMQGVKKKGQQPRPFYTEVINKNLAAIVRPQIEKILGRSIEIIIAEPWQ